MIPPYGGGDPSTVVDPNTPNYPLAYTKAGWQSISDFVNGGLVSGISDLSAVRAQINGDFYEGVNV